MTPEEQAHKDHSDNCELCKKQAEDRLKSEASPSGSPKSFLSAVDWKVFTQRTIGTGVMLALLYLSFNVGQLQSYYTIDYYNHACTGGSFFSNEPSSDVIQWFTLQNITKPEPEVSGDR